MAVSGWQGSLPPIGSPVVLNRRSQQANGLAFWLPMAAGAPPADLARGFPLTWSAGSGNFEHRVYPTVGLARFAASGANHPITIGGGGVPSGSTSYSIAAWIMSTSAVSYQTILTAGSGSGFWLMSDFKLNMYNGGDKKSAGAVAINTWNHVAVVVVAGVTTFYINGALDANTYSGTPAMTFTKIFEDGGSDRFVGAIGEVRMYTRALSGDEVFQLYAPQTRWQLYGVPVSRRGVPLSAVFRRTLSQHGTRIGSRQVAD